MSRTPVLCVVGPTASGKSTLAEDVALELGGEIVSVDSMQVYRGMDVGTAKVPEGERRCRLHMVDVARVDEPYSVACFQRDARACVDDIAARGLVPVLCGGTGLYLDATIDEMVFPHGETNGRVRSPYERLAQERGPEALHALLRERDPESAEIIHPNNVRRVVRALELCDEGTSYAKHHEGLLRREPHYDARLWAIHVERRELYERIDERVDAMFENGLVDEVRALDALGIRGATTASQAIGYKEVLAFLSGEHDEDRARELVKRNTRRYAKRQLSWLKRDGRVRWVDAARVRDGSAVETIVEDWRSSWPRVLP